MHYDLFETDFSGACINILLRVHGWLYDMVCKSGDFVGESQLLPARPHVGDSASEALDCSLLSRRETSQVALKHVHVLFSGSSILMQATCVTDQSAIQLLKFIDLRQIVWVQPVKTQVAPFEPHEPWGCWTTTPALWLCSAMQYFHVFSARPEARVAAWNHHWPSPSKVPRSYGARTLDIWELTMLMAVPRVPRFGGNIENDLPRKAMKSQENNGQ